MISVLYVDDEPLLLELGKLFLEKSGQFSVDTETSAPAALDLLKDRRYDAIISDYQMPRMDGIEFLKRVRASGSTLPFIIFTGRGREEIVIQALNEGADFYLQKGGEPVSQFAELAHKVRKAVQQRRAETSIRDHERREADIINFLPDATFAIDTGGTVIAWNRAMEKMTGIAPEAVLGKGNYEYALPFYHERRPILIDLVLRDDPATASKYPSIRRDGKNLFSEITIPHFNGGRGAALWFTASPLYDTRGRVVGAIESIREITERKKAEEALHESERRFRELADLLPQAVYEAETDGTLTYANRFAFDLFGYTEDELREGLNVLDVIVPEERGRAQDAIRGMFEGKAPAGQGGEFLAQRKDGSTLPVSIYASPITVGARITGFRGIIVDISGRKKAEEALKDSEVRFRSLIQNASDMIRILDRDGRIVYESPSANTLLGYPDGENIGKDALAFVHPDDLGRVRADLRQVFDRTNSGSPTEFRIRKADGTWIWVDTVATNLLDLPAINGIVVTTRPIEQRKKMENDIRESEEKYRAIFENTGTATIQVEEDLVISRVNSTFERLTGYRRDEIEGKRRWTAFVHPDDIERMAEYHRLRREPGSVAPLQYEFRLLAKDGTVKDILLSVGLIPGTKKSIASLVDLTDQKKTKDDLLAANQEYVSLLSQIQDVYYRSDNDGRLVKASQSWAALLGYDNVDECIGRSIADDFYANPADRKQFLEQVFRDGKVTNYEVLLKKKDGTPLLVATNSHLTRDAFGNVSGIEGTFRDITELKQQETILRTQLDLGLALQKIHGLHDTLEACLDAAIRISGMDSGGIYLVGEETGSLDLAVSKNLSKDFVATISGYPAGSANARMVMEGKPLFVPYRKTGLVHTPVQEREGLRALAIVPIASAGRIIACINVSSHTQDSIPAGSRVALETIATQIGAGIDRIRADEALLRSEQKYRNVVEDQTEFISRFTPDGTHVFVNEAYCRYFGLSRDEILGHRFRPKIHPGDQDRVQLFFASLTPDHPVDTIEHRIIMPDGTVRWQRWSDRAIFDPSENLTEYQSVGRDTTDRNEAELALRESGERYQVLFDQSPVAIREEDFSGVREYITHLRDNGVTDFSAHFTAHPEDVAECAGRVLVLDANQSSLRFFGVRDSDELSRNLASSFTEESYPVFRDELVALAKGQNSFTAEVPICNLQGERRIVNLYLAVVPGHEQALDRVLVSFVDITERKTMEASLRGSEERYRNFIANASEGIFRIDFTQPVSIAQPRDQLIEDIADHAVVGEVNESLASMYGLRPEDMTGHMVREFAPNCGTQMADLLMTPEYRIIEREETEVGADGGPITIVESYFGVVDDGVLRRVWGVQRNVTDRKRAEMALRESEEKYRTILDTTSEWIWEIGLDGRHTYTNAAVYDLLGYNTGEFLQFRAFDLMHPDDIPGVKKVFSASVQNREGWRSRVIRWRHKDGTWRYLESNATPVFNDRGELTGFRGADRDITEHREAEDKLKDSEARFSSLFNASPVPLLLTEPENGRLLAVNDATVSLFGYAREEMLGKTTVDLGIWADPVERRAQLQMFRDAGSVRNAETRVRSKSGQISEVLFNSDSIVYSGEPAIITAIYDITGRKKTEAALHQSEEKFRNLIELAQEGIWIIDPAGITTYVNPKTAEMLGYTVEEMTKSPMSRYMDERGRKIAARNYPEYRKGVREQVEFEFLRKDGSLITALVSNTSLFDTTGRFTGAMAVITDITDRKRTEKDLVAAYREYQTLLDNIQDGYYRTDNKGRLVRISQSMPGLFGYDDILDLLGRDLAETAYFNPADRETVLAEIRENGKVTNYELRLKRRDGTPVWVSANSHLWHHPDGSPGGVEGTFRDITETKRMGDELRQKTEALDYRNRVMSTLLDTVPIGIFMVEATSGKPIVANQEAGRLLGRGILPDATEDNLAEAYEAYKAGTSVRYPTAEMPVIRGMHGKSSHIDDMVVVRPDGTAVQLEVFGTPVFDSRGRVAASLVCFLDITGRKQAEEALRVAQEKYAKAFLAAPDAITISDLDSGQFIEVNDAATALFGYSRAELIGKSATELGIWVRKEDRDAFVDRLVNDGRVHGYEISERRKSGRLYHALINADTLTIGGRRYIISIIRDITGWKEAEETIRSLAQFPDENPFPVMRITGDGTTILYINTPGREWLAEFADSAGQQVPEMVRSLVSGAMENEGTRCTEIQERMDRVYLVTAIRPGGETYVNIYITDISEQKHAERTIAETNRKLSLLTSITRHDVTNQIAILRGFAQIALMKRPDTPVADLLEKIDETGATIARQIEFTRTYQELGIHAPGWYRISGIIARQPPGDITVSCTCGAEVFADPMLDKVFFNLLDNAARHGERTTDVTVRCEECPAGLVITVADNGTGVSPGLKEKIFEKGYGKHTGFGLFLAREILAITDISIREDGVHGQGARFEITVPKGGYRLPA